MNRLLALLLLVSPFASAPAFAPAAFAPAAFAQAAAPNPSFNLVNKSAQPIRELYVSPSGHSNFGQNRLPNGPIAPGARFAVRLLADGNCVFDVRAVYADGTHEDRRTLDTCTADDVTVGAPAGTAPRSAAKEADDPSFRLTNRGTQAVLELYATPTGKPRGENLLVDSPLPPKSSRVITLDRALGCRFDLRVVLADKSAKQRRATDLCRITDLPVP